MDEDDTADFVADSMDEEDHQVSLLPVILLWHQHDVLCYDSCKRGHVLKTMAVSFVGCCCSNVPICSYTPDASLMTDQVQKSHARVLLACHASMHMLSLCCHIWCPPNLYMFLCSCVCCYMFCSWMLLFIMHGTTSLPAEFVPFPQPLVTPAGICLASIIALNSLLSAPVFCYHQMPKDDPQCAKCRVPSSHIYTSQY